ncbi:unnamed protein product [Toxocara canis]|uniref:MSP domain-containing protein n=1 Tax=Toxocara canis TaxID=6265 RepID=A0A183VB29_TOXCA|nr:unnamed protein product [Toxocara canis]
MQVNELLKTSWYSPCTPYSSFQPGKPSKDRLQIQYIVAPRKYDPRDPFPKDTQVGRLSVELKAIEGNPNEKDSQKSNSKTIGEATGKSGSKSLTKSVSEEVKKSEEKKEAKNVHASAGGYVRVCVCYAFVRVFLCFCLRACK